MLDCDCRDRDKAYMVGTNNKTLVLESYSGGLLRGPPQDDNDEESEDD